MVTKMNLMEAPQAYLTALRQCKGANLRELYEEAKPFLDFPSPIEAEMESKMKEILDGLNAL